MEERLKMERLNEKNIKRHNIYICIGAWFYLMYYEYKYMYTVGEMKQTGIQAHFILFNNSFFLRFGTISLHQLKLELKLLIN